MFPHLKRIIDYLVQVEEGTVKRLAIHMPPRHGKSETVTVRFILRQIEIDPTSNYLITSYSDRFAKRLSRKIRTLAEARHLTVSDKTAVDEWELIGGGSVVARGVGAAPTGIGFKYIVIDDPIRNREDANSEAFRQKSKDWYLDDILSRLEPGGAVIVVATRWHHDDVCQFAYDLEPGEWTRLILPAIDERQKPLCPERYDLKALLDIKDRYLKSGDMYGWESLYQQNPTPREGAMFKVGKINFIDAADVPKTLKKCRGWDVASSAGKGDFTAGVGIGIDDIGRVIVWGVVRGQYGPDERREVIKQTAARDGKDVQIVGPEDPGSAGKDAAIDFIRMLNGYKVKVKRQTGSKGVRADAFASQLNAGNVYIVRASWNSEYIEELRQFPGGKNDDQVDGSSEAYNELVSSGGSAWNW